MDYDPIAVLFQRACAAGKTAASLPSHTCLGPCRVAVSVILLESNERCGGTIMKARGTSVSSSDQQRVILQLSDVRPAVRISLYLDTTI